MTSYNKLKEIYAAYHEQAQRLVENAEIQDEASWDCPMCGGEGTVDHCIESPVITTGELECAGLQMFGIGAGVNDTQTLLRSLILLSPKMFAVVDAAMEVVEVDGMLHYKLFNAVAALREE